MGRFQPFLKHLALNAPSFSFVDVTMPCLDPILQTSAWKVHRMWLDMEKIMMFSGAECWKWLYFWGWFHLRSNPDSSMVPGMLVDAVMNASVQTKSTIVKCASHCTEAHKSVTHDLT
jgi:hypothetical protein